LVLVVGDHLRCHLASLRDINYVTDLVGGGDVVE